MSGSAFAVTHHAFSSGAGRTSDGNGSHASTLKSPSYTKSVSWQHYRGFYVSGQNHWPLWRCLIHLFYHHRLDVVPDSGDVRHCDAKQPHCEPTGGNNAQTAADHRKPDIIRPTKTDVDVLARNIITALRSCQRRRTTPVVRVAIKQFL